MWSITDALNGGRNQSYGYDALNRITAGSQTDGAFNQTFSYDAFGNMKQDGNPITTSSFSFNEKTQMVGGSIAYDAAGNMTTTNTGQNLNYNAESQLVSLNNGLVNYSYDASGDRIRKDLPGRAFTEYVYFGGTVIAEKDQARDWTDYVYANGQRLAKADSFENGIMISGTNCSDCGIRHSWFMVNDAQYLSGYTIQPGDKLYFRQYQNNARGGMGVFFRDGTNTAWNAVDQNGNLTNDDPGQQVWDQRSVDLSNNKAPWDYKQEGGRFQEFGNFNFGATGAAAGIQLQVLLRGAGWSQRRSGTSSKNWNHWYSFPPYEDDPKDQAAVLRGFNYYEFGCNQ